MRLLLRVQWAWGGVCVSVHTRARARASAWSRGSMRVRALVCAGARACTCAWRRAHFGFWVKSGHLFIDAAARAARMCSYRTRTCPACGHRLAPGTQQHRGAHARWSRTAVAMLGRGESWVVAIARHRIWVGWCGHGVLPAAHSATGENEAILGSAARLATGENEAILRRRLW